MFASLTSLVAYGPRRRPEDQDVTYWVQEGDLHQLRAWLDAHPDWDINAPDAEGMAPLHWAADRGLVAVALLLLNAGADVDVEVRTKKH